MAAQRGKKLSKRKKLTTGDKLSVRDSMPLFFERMLAKDLSPKSRVKLLCDSIDVLVNNVRSVLPEGVEIIPVGDKLFGFKGVKGANIGFIFIVDVDRVAPKYLQELSPSPACVRTQLQSRQTSQKAQLS